MPVEAVFFDATLAPYRSLPSRGFFWIMATLSAIGFSAGIGFVLAGAWPVTGFFGLDVALVYLAFRVSYRGARQREILRLTQARLDIERISVRGERRRWQFQPFWLRVVFEERDDGQNRLLVASHGQSLVLGAFLGPAERRSLAEDLGAALLRWRGAIKTMGE